MRAFRIVAAIISISATLIVFGCSQSPFVGMPTPVPEQIIIDHQGNAPVPEFGPRDYSRLYEAPGEKPPELEDVEIVSAEPAFAWSETENFLMLGTDRRPWDASWRTDTIMVIGIDRQRNRIAVISIPRDLYLEIPQYGYGRINQADYIGERITRVEGGGPALISEMLNETFGIKTEHWVRFEMTGFQAIVDAVGGVTMHLDCPFFEPIMNLDTGEWEYFTLPAGDVHMDGETAYWYVRLRLRESDIGRSNRQRQLIWSLRDQMLSENMIVRLPELYNAFQHSFKTDLNIIQLLELANFALSLDSSNVRASGITLKELQSHTTASGASVLIITEPQKVQALIDGIWEAPTMLNANRKDADLCQPIPTGPPVIPTEIFAPTVKTTATPADSTSVTVEGEQNTGEGG